MKKPACADEDIFEGVKAALRVVDGVNMRIEHLDIQCDGCGREPIVGDRCVDFHPSSGSLSFEAYAMES